MKPDAVDEARDLSMPTIKRVGFSTAFLLLTGLAAGRAAAQAYPPGYEPIPVTLGAFTVDPSIGVSTTYQDNYLALPNNGKSLLYVTVSPDVTVSSNWSRNQISAHAYLSTPIYSQVSSEAYTTGGASLTGRLDTFREGAISLTADYSRSVLPRTATNSGFFEKHPDRYETVGVSSGFSQNFGRFSVNLNGGIHDIKNDNNETQSGFTILRQDLDNTIYNGSVSLNYNYSPEIAYTIRFDGNTRKFRNAAPGEILRDSAGLDVTVGVNFQLTHLLEGQIRAGYLQQNYDNHVFRSFSGASVQANLSYSVTRLTTITVNASRSVQDATSANIAGYLNSTIGVDVRHELLRNLILTGGVQYGHNDFGSFDRADDRWSWGAGARYLMNRAVSFSIGVNRLTQASSGIHRGPEFNDDSVSASVSYRF